MTPADGVFHWHGTISVDTVVITPLTRALAAHGVEYAISYEAAAQHYEPRITHVS